ncbi:MAG: hypothetical protein V3R81_04845, partial [Gammaproteobacteria bacterium]
IFMSQGGEYLAWRAGEAYDQIVVDIVDDIEAGGRYTITEPSPERLSEYRQQYIYLHQQWINQTNNGAEAYALALEVLEELRDAGE